MLYLYDKLMLQAAPFMCSNELVLMINIQLIALDLHINKVPY